MKATEFIRGLLDLIDSVDQNTDQAADYEDETTAEEVKTQYSNSPDEQITPTSTIMSMGNDVNKPKNPADIRANSISMYPDWQARKN